LLQRPHPRAILGPPIALKNRFPKAFCSGSTDEWGRFTAARGARSSAGAIPVS
jgi:hypothetical protein